MACHLPGFKLTELHRHTIGGRQTLNARAIALLRFDPEQAWPNESTMLAGAKMLLGTDPI